MSRQETEIKNWDVITKIILAISILILAFTFVSPIIFTSPATKSNYDFTNTVYAIHICSVIDILLELTQHAKFRVSYICILSKPSAIAI